MIRTFEEMERDNTLTESPIVSFHDWIALAIVAGDYFRARRRRFPLGITELTSKDKYADGFNDEAHAETAEANVRDIYRYATVDYTYNHYLFDSHKEYVDD